MPGTGFATALAPDQPAPTPAADTLAGKKPSPADNPLAGYDQQLAGMRSQEADIDRSELASREQIEQRREGLQVPQLQQVPPPQERTTDPQKQWGSAAMMLAVFGSLLTRQPLTTAMNSAAAAIKAFHQGDQEAFQTAFKSWQVANDNATKLYEFQQRSYENILGHLDREENLVREEASDKRREVQGQMQAQAAAFRDQVMLDRLDQQGVEGAERLQIERQRLGIAMQEAARKNTEFADYQSGLQELEKTPEYQRASPLERAALRHSLSKGVAPWFWKETDKALTAKGRAAHAANAAARKQVTDQMAAYKATHSQINPITADDPTWKKLTNALAVIDANDAKIKTTFAKLDVHVGEEGGGNKDDPVKGGEKYGSAADVKKAYQAHEISRDQASKILKDNGWAS